MDGLAPLLAAPDIRCRDIARDVFEQIDQAVSKLRLGELRSFVPVEIFRGGNVPAGRYSILLRAVFQSSERTLREDEVGRWSEQIIKALQAVGGILRS